MEFPTGASISTVRADDPNAAFYAAENSRGADAHASAIVAEAPAIATGHGRKARQVPYASHAHK
jgi:hypothetical protein